MPPWIKLKMLIENSLLNITLGTIITVKKANKNLFKSIRHSKIFLIPEKEKSTIHGFMEK